MTAHRRPHRPPLNFDEFLALDWVELTEEIARVRFEIRDDLRQPHGLLHGGIYCAVAETVASVATAKGVSKDGFIAMGMNNHASFMRPVAEGWVDGVCRRLGHGDQRWTWAMDFTDDAGRLCAAVHVTIAIRRRAADFS